MATSSGGTGPAPSGGSPSAGRFRRWFAALPRPEQAVIAAAVGAVGAVLAAAVTVAPSLWGGKSTPPPTATPSPPSIVEVNTPYEGQRVHGNIIVAGTVGNLPEMESLWVVLYSPGAADYYPEAPCDRDVGGDPHAWRCGSIPTGTPVNGTPEDKVEIVIWQVDDNGNKLLEGYRRDAAARGYNGYPLPLGGREVAKVVVVRT